MATSLQECSICFEEITAPMKLPCDHTFCNECVNKLNQNDVIMCPFCNEVHHFSEVRHDFKYLQFLEELQEERKRMDDEVARILQSLLVESSASKDCDLCEEHESKYWCNACANYMCSSCSTAHARLTESHDTVPKERPLLELRILEIEKHIEVFDSLVDKMYRIVLRQDKRVAMYLRESTKSSKKAAEKRAEKMLRTPGLVQKAVASSSDFEEMEIDLQICKDHISKDTSNASQLVENLAETVAERLKDLSEYKYSDRFPFLTAKVRTYSNYAVFIHVCLLKAFVR